MRSLDLYLSSIDFSTELRLIRTVTDLAEVKTTFWGSRVVEIKDFSGSVSLNQIAQKILTTSEERCRRDDLSTEERLVGLEIVRNLKKFYLTSDKQLRQSNFLTRFFNWIREFHCTPYTTRFFIEERAEENFRSYSEAKFLAQFGSEFTKLLDHPASNGSSGPPLRIQAKEERILQLLTR